MCYCIESDLMPGATIPLFVARYCYQLFLSYFSTAAPLLVTAVCLVRCVLFYFSSVSSLLLLLTDVLMLRVCGHGKNMCGSKLSLVWSPAQKYQEKEKHRKETENVQISNEI